MDFKDYLQHNAREIDETINGLLSEWNKDVDKISVQLASLSKSFLEASFGGKRLRGSLLKLGYEIASESNNTETIKPAAALEIFQTAILAHDDIIDQSDLRRGKPTIWKALGGDHYAISQTICLGDIGFFLANKLIAESKFELAKRTQVLSLFSEMVINTGLGEMLDVKLSQKALEKSEADVWTISKLKTADYTITYPLKIGAVLAGANQKLLKNIEKFGENLGVAFQIQDDILGVFGDEETLGKSVTSDIEEGKNTLLIIYALKKANRQQKQVLNQYYGKGKIGEREYQKIKQVFIETGAKKFAQEKAQSLVSQAKGIIKQMDIKPEYQEMLTQMADFLVERNK